MDLFPKYIVEKDGDELRLIISKVSYHKDLAIDPKMVRGGGWFIMQNEAKKITFHGDSHDFGQAALEDVKKCVEAGNVFSNKYSDHSIVDKYTFFYSTGSETIQLNKNDTRTN